MSDTWRDEFNAVFARFDGDANGSIDHAEFNALLDALGSKLSPRDRELGFKMIDKDEDGTITRDELAAWWDIIREEAEEAE